MPIIVVAIYGLIAIICYRKMPISMQAIIKLFWALLWPVTFVFFWLFLLIGGFVAPKLKNSTSEDINFEQPHDEDDIMSYDAKTGKLWIKK
jgi:hypothetical protein